MKTIIGVLIAVVIVLGIAWFVGMQKEPITEAPLVLPEAANESVDEEVELVAIYTATLSAASEGGDRDFTLRLENDGELTLATNFSDEVLVTETGRWQVVSVSAIEVVLQGTETRIYDTPQVIQFTISGDQLVATEYDESQYGSAGLTLTSNSAVRVSDLAMMQEVISQEL